MANPNDPTNYNREIREDSSTDANGNTESHVTRTTETGNSNSYRDGYVDGRVTESGYKEENLIERDENNSARGLLLGILLASLAALTGGAVWYFNQPKAVDNTPTTVVVPVPTNASPTPEAIQTPQPQTTIIERTREVPVAVPVPQQVAPPPTAEKPQINITIPPQPIPTKTAPAIKSETTSPSVTKTDTSTSPKVTKTDTTTTTTTSPKVTKSDTTTSPATKSDTSTTQEKSTSKSNSTSVSGDSSTDGSTK
ncbi:MAG: hypothetical protein H0X31_21365 [Nostocaceae cyanobacterium]|nr:hypothetical protein [Nostocaceae cyanobacterium]